MIPTTHNAQPVFLLDDAPDWQQPLKTTWQLLLATTIGLSQREARRPHSDTLRCSMQYQTTRTGATARQLVGALRDYTTQPVLCPLWPAVARWDEPLPVDGRIFVVWRADWSQWEIFEDHAEPSWPIGEDLVAPLMWGRLVNRDLAWPSNDTLAMDVQFEETGPADYALTPAEAAFPSYPLPPEAGYTAPPLYPFLTSFAGIEDSLRVQLLREQIGFTRDQAETYYSQAVARGIKVPFLLRTQSLAFAFLRFFADTGGAAAFWSPGWMGAAALTADVAATDDTLNVSDTASVRAGDYIALLSAGASTQAQVASLTPTTLTLPAPVGHAYSRADTIITPLLLVRLDKPQLDIQFLEPDVARVDLQLREVPPEYSPAADESIGSTLGALPTRCWLYEFSRVLDGAAYYNRYTSYESDLSHAGNTYTSAKIDHGEIKGSLSLENDEVTLKADSFSGNPLLLLPQLKLETPLRLVIRAGEVSGTAALNTTVLFTGEVVGVKVKGSRLQAKCTALGSVFDRKFPRFFIQPYCNHTLFDPGCTLLPADWKFTATIYDPGSAGYPFTLILRDLARVVGSLPASIFANWFAGGWIETGAGLTWQRRPILTSTLYTGSPPEMTIRLDRDLDPFPIAGQAAALYPGCDLTPETCKAYDAGTNPRGKFDNYANFGGHPFVPAANPSLVKLAQQTDGAKK